MAANANVNAQCISLKNYQNFYRGIIVTFCGIIVTFYQGNILTFLSKASFPVIANTGSQLGVGEYNRI